MSESTPTFRGTKPSLSNSCASCGSQSTAGCWRRGWIDSDNNSVNLCNRCGLQFKNGKLDTPVNNPTPIKTESKPSPSTPPVVPQIETMTKEKAEFVSYSMVRESDDGVSKRVLFYLHEKNGTSKLAIRGIDSRGTGHFVYESVEDFIPPLKCTNRANVISWLNSLGAVQQLDRNESISAQTMRKSSRVPTKPKLDKEYVDYREDHGKEDSVCFENFYVVDAQGEETLAVCGSFANDCYVYRCVLDSCDIRFEDKTEAIGWIEWIVRKAELPPLRFQRKESRKSTKKRDASPTTPQEHANSKARVTPLSLEEMRGIFGDPELVRWVLRKPSMEEIETFEEWKNILSMESTLHEEEASQSTEDAEEVLKILQSLQKRETCVKLLEMTSIGRPISKLTMHPNKEVADLASELSVKWNEWTNQALAKVTAARNT